jgi:uncharacterized protein YbaR (Trm112 family)
VHLLLTDRLTCSRCGPTFGLILLAERVEERRVLEGSLGCPNCRDLYPVRAGFGDLRPPPREPWSDAGGDDLSGLPTPAPDLVGALAAGLGLGQGAGNTLLMGNAVGLAPALAGMLPEIEVVALDARTRAWPESPGVSRLRAGAALPFFGGTLRGVALDGTHLEPALAGEIVRVLAPGHRIVVLDPGPAVASLLHDAGLPDVVEAPSMLVAGR